jgi:hypothetical protein
MLAQFSQGKEESCFAIGKLEGRQKAYIIRQKSINKGSDAYSTSTGSYSSILESIHSFSDAIDQEGEKVEYK